MKTKWSVDNVINITVNVSRAGLYAVACCMLLWLNVNSMSAPGILAVFAALLFSVGVGFFLEKITSAQKWLEWIVLGVCCILFGLVCIWWVSIVPYEMEGDQAIVWTAAALALEDNFVMYSHGGQMFIYPQQQGLAFLYEMLFRLTGSTNPQMIGYVNAALAPITLFFGYQCVKECAGKKTAVRFLPLMMLCLPYIIYSPYVYGDIPSICYSFVLFWGILKFMKTTQYRYVMVACLAASLGLVSRKNIWIFFVGLLIGMAYHTLQKKNIKPIVVAVCIVLSASLSMTGIKQWNSVRSGYPVSSGMPTVLWLAMGLQYSEYGAGHYNNYSKHIYQQVDCDGEEAAAIGLQEVKRRIKTFLQYPDQCGMFFKEKMRSQWVKPLFDSVKSTGTLSSEHPDELSPIVFEIYQGQGQKVLKQFCSMMMSIVYFFSLVGVVLRYFKKRPIAEDIPLIVFVGGFFFSIVWEAKARYMFPYFVLLHMYAAYGMTDVSEFLETTLVTLKGKKEK